VRVVGADGFRERVLKTNKSPGFITGGPAWSPDGKQIAVATVGSSLKNENLHRFIVLDPDTGEERVLPGLGSATISIDWLSDGSGLVATASETNQGPLRQVWFIGYPSGTARRLTNDLTDHALLSASRTTPTFISVAWEQRGNIWIFDVDTSEARQITSGTGVEGRFRIDWFPDGRIVFPVGSGEHSDLVVVRSDGTGPRQILTQPGQVAKRPVISPDGRRIAFNSTRSGAAEVWVMNADGNDVHQVTRNGDAQRPQFTTDGQSILFGKGLVPTGGVWKVSVAGGEPVRLFTGAGSLSLPPTSFPRSLSRDGRLLLISYQHEADRSERFGVVPMDGSQPWRPLAAAPVAPDLIVWSADSRTLTYVLSRNDVSNVWQLPIDGATPTQLTRFTSGEIFGLGWSQDGKQLALSRGTSTSDVVLITHESSASSQP